jgi:hypothetical protein
MTQSSTIFDRIDQAAKLSRQLTGKAAARTVSDAFVTERIADIKALHQSGVSLARYARLVAPALGVRPSALLAAFGRAGLTSQPTAPHASEVAKTETTTAPQAPVIATKLRASHDLPSWADGSDQRNDESDEDYRLRKQLEGPPSAGLKAIGESPAERAEALLKSGKLGFGASGPTEGDRKILIALIERFGANTVERRIDIECKALPPGDKLYPSKLRARMTGDSHA